MTEPKLNSLVERLRTRAQIRRQIPERKSVQEGKADRIADLLDEAANAIESQANRIAALEAALRVHEVDDNDGYCYRCAQSWIKGQSESHSTDCLLAGSAT